MDGFELGHSGSLNDTVDGDEEEVVLGAVLVGWDDGDDLLFLIEVEEVDGWHAFGVSGSVWNHVATHSVNLTEGCEEHDVGVGLGVEH